MPDKILLSMSGIRVGVHRSDDRMKPSGLQRPASVPGGVDRRSALMCCNSGSHFIDTLYIKRDQPNRRFAGIAALMYGNAISAISTCAEC